LAEDCRIDCVGELADLLVATDDTILVRKVTDLEELLVHENRVLPDEQIVGFGHALTHRVSGETT
jgi:hypothetical protein